MIPRNVAGSRTLGRELFVGSSECDDLVETAFARSLKSRNL